MVLRCLADHGVISPVLFITPAIPPWINPGSVSRRRMLFLGFLRKSVQVS